MFGAFFGVTRNQQAGPPFVPSSAENGLSVDPVSGRIVLGNDVAGILATLLSNREIPMSTFSLLFSWAAAQSLTIGALGSAALINASITNAATLLGLDLQHNVATTFDGFRIRNNNANGFTEIIIGNNINNGMVINVAGSTAAGANTTIQSYFGAESRFFASGAANFFRWFTGAGAGTQRMVLLANGRLRLAANNTDNTCLLQVDGSIGGDKLISPRNITPVNINLNQERGFVFTNEGTAAVLLVFNLPSAAANYMYDFVVRDAGGIQITAAAGDTIRIGTTVTAAAGNISSTEQGSTIRMIAINATEWIGQYISGTWVI